MKARYFLAAMMLAVLLVVSAIPVSAAIDLRGVMDMHAYQNTAISETAILPYRIYLPDAIAAAFPKSADNAVIVPDGEDTEAPSGEETETEAVNDTPVIEIPQDREYGLLIWLHDEDCRGNDGVSHISDDAKNGLINTFLASSDYANNFIVIAPQCPQGTQWTDNDNLYLRLLIDLIQNHVMQIPIDEDRIFVSGISMGATAGYQLITMQGSDPSLPVAAAYLVAGTCDYVIENEEDAAVFGATKVYAFLSENDTVTPPDSVRAIADLINTTYDLPQDFTYAIYPEVGHEVWHQAFAEQGLLQAFMSTNAPAVQAPVETEAVTDAPEETEAPATEAPVPAETEPQTEEILNTPPSIGGITITSQMIAGVILCAACVLSMVILIAGLIKNNKVR